jgi:hypothetical protein
MQAILTKANHYTVTSEYYFQSKLSGQTYRVFDESDDVLKSGESLFTFMTVGETYDVKIFMMAEQTDKADTTYTFSNEYTPAEETFAVLVNEAGDEFYAEMADVEGLKLGDTAKIDSQRLDLMQVDDVLYGDYK